MKETDIQVQEAQKAPNKMKQKRLTPRHIIIKVSTCKNNEYIKQREKQLVMYKRTPIKQLIFSAETLQARREHYVFKVLKGKHFQWRICYKASLLLKTDRETRLSLNKQKLKEFINTKWALQEILQELL